MFTDAEADATLPDRTFCRSTMLKNYEANQKENGYWMNILYSYFWENSDMATGYADTVNGITAADLQHFAKDFFSQNNRIEVSMTSGDTK